MEKVLYVSRLDDVMTKGEHLAALLDDLLLRVATLCSKEFKIRNLLQ